MSVLQGAVETTGPVSRLHQKGSFDPADFAVPTGREEEWRFTPLRRLRGLHQSPSGDGAVSVDVAAAPGVTSENTKRGDPRIGRALTPADRVSALAFAGFAEATVVSIPAGLEAETPTWVTVRGQGTAEAAFGHTVVEVGANARASVVIEHVGSATFADNVEFVVGDGAQLSVVSLQDWADDAVHLSHHGLLVGRDARVTHTVVSLGGNLVRLAPSVRYAGPGGDAELRGLYFADAGQHLEHRLFVDHGERSCRSRVSYKGALRGQDAHAVWIGDVAIRAEATGTDTYEYNRNLVLSDGTRVDSVPNLEILTGEVIGAGHASASGRLEDQHLFYLMARGIPLDEARRLVIQGFFGQLIDQIEVEQVRERVSAAIERELTW
jgi:Fe-S cluster assembly protein SufD